MKKSKKFVSVELSLDKKTLFWLFVEAHRKNITLNKLVNKFLTDYIDELEAKDKIKK